MSNLVAQKGSESIDEIEALFGERLRTVREAVGLTLSDLAERMEVTTQAIQQWESGVTSPRLNRIYRLAHVLGVSISYLMPDTLKSDAFDANAARLQSLAERIARLPDQKVRALSVILEVAL